MPETIVIPRLSVSNLTFSDNTVVSLGAGDVVVIVGPNNAGKSATLRGIRDKVVNPGAQSPVLQAVALSRQGLEDDVAAWVRSVARLNVNSNPIDPTYQAFGTAVSLNQARNIWSGENSAFQQLGRFFCHLLPADERLTAANPAPAIALTHDAYTHPIHYLLRNDSLEQKISARFRKAFGVDLVIHRNAGNRVPLLVGDRPIPAIGEDRLSYDYIVRLERLPPLESQGDGMRSFAGVLLHTSVGQESMLLVDEPEAFLHPPQARLLGKMLVEEKAIDRQVFVATHSGDVLRGVLDSDLGNVRVVRIRREKDSNFVRELNNEKVRELWKDSLLRSSNILDGVFHEKVVVCESDSDARFFAAVAGALEGGSVSDHRKPDIMFTHCGGKSRLPMVVRSLRALDVPVAAVADFDILNDEHPLSDLISAAGGDWETLKPVWNSVKTSIDAIRPQLNTVDVKREIQAALASVIDANFPRESQRRIEDILKRSSPWALAKRSGKSFVPNGTPTRQYNSLATRLREIGIFIVEVGELERFYPAAGGHGPAWVNEVLTKDLRSDPDLQAARDFVRSLLAT